MTTSAGGITSVAGMEIASTSSADRQTTSHVAFYADRFYITHSASSAAVIPFEVVGGKVYIKSAVIQDASITSAKIQDAAINSAHIGSAVVKTLHIGAEQVVVPGGNQGQYSTSVTMYSEYPINWMIIATFTQGDGKDKHRWVISIDGVEYDTATPNAGTLGAMGRIINLAAGTHTFRISCDQTTGDGGCSIAVFGAKR